MSYYLSTLFEEDKAANPVLDTVVVGTTSGGGGDYELYVSGDTYVYNLDVANEFGVTGDLTIDTNTLYVDSADNRVGIVNLDPQYELDISGETKTNVLNIQELDTRYRIGRILDIGAENSYIDTFGLSNTLVDSDGTWIASASSMDPYFLGEPYNVFDGDINTLWTSDATYDFSDGSYIGAVNLTGTYAGEWIKLQTPKKLIVRQYSLTSDTSFGPVNFKLFGSNNDSDWVELDEQTGQSFPANPSTKTYTINLTEGYTYFAIVTNKSTSNAAVEFYQIYFIGSFITSNDGLGIGITDNETFFNITPTENIGIGTASPSYKLDIKGDTYIGITQPDLFVDTSNNFVGIGITNPSTKLDISGDVNTSGVYRVDGTEVLSGTGITLSSGDITVNNLTVSGDTTINGTLTTINSTTVQIEDNLLKLAIGNTADTVDSGFYSLYNDGTSKYAGIFRDATDDTFKFFTGLQDEPTSTVNTGGTGYSLADLYVKDLTATNLYGTLQTATQTKITKVGTLTSLNLSGNLTINGGSMDILMNIGPYGESIYTSNGAGINRIKHRGYGGNYITDVYANYVQHTSPGYFSWNTGGSERMRITSGGNVGIGTTSPSYKLDIKGDTYIGITQPDLFVDTSNNNVGIGTTSPTEKLDVNGNLQMNSNDIKGIGVLYF